MKPRLLFGMIALCFIFSALAIKADLSLHTYNADYNGTYTAITGGSTLGDQYNDDDVFEDLAIGFTFNFDGTDYTRICVAANGFVGFGSSMNNSYYPIGDDWSGIENVLSPLGGDLQAQTGASLRIQTLGSAPNRVCVVQWANYCNYGYSGDAYNFQVRLYETTNRIEFHYGSFDASDWFWYQTGIRTDNYDYRNLYVNPYDNSWSDIWEMDDPWYGVEIYYDYDYPPSGLVLSWELVPYHYEYATVYQETRNVPKGANNQVVLAIELGIDGVAYPVSVDGFTFNTTGTTNVSDISNARLYYTEQSPNFSTATQYGIAIDNPNGTFEFNDDLELEAGAFYFWLTYDVSSTAATGNVIDAQCPIITVGGVDYEPDNYAPSGNRAIVSPLSGVFTVGSGGNYPNLYNAFLDLNSRGMNGDITYNIISNITEPNPAEMISPIQTGDGGYDILIKPYNGSWTVSGNFTTPVIIINSTQNVTIDGSNSGGTSRNLTIVNSGTNAGASGAVAAVFSNNFTAKNLITYCSARNIGYGFLLNRVENGRLENNRIYKANSGIYVTNESKQITVTKNLIGSSTASDAVRAFGLYFFAGPATAKVGDYSADDFTISYNEINGMYNDETALAVIRGILLGDAKNGKVMFNKIHNLTNTATAVYGVQTSGYHTARRNLNLDFSNNFITNLNAANSYISYMMPHSQSNARYYHNTINANGASSTNFVATVYMHQDIEKVEFMNNILHHNQTGSTMHGINVITASNPFSKIDGNAYSLMNTNAYYGYINGVNYNAFGDWATAVNGEKNAKAGRVYFTSDGLHIDGSSVIDLMVNPITSVATDWDGETRRTDKTNIGADEAIPVLGIRTDLTDLSNTIFCPGSTAQFSFVPEISSFRDGIARTVDGAFEYTFFKNGEKIEDKDGDNITINGNTLTISDLLEERDKALYSAQAELLKSKLYTSERQLKVETPIKITSQLVSRNVCVGDPSLVLSIDAEGTTYGSGDYKGMNGYQWQKEDPANPGSYFDIVGENSSVYNLPLINAQQARGKYRVLVLGPGNCGSSQLVSNTAEVDVSEPLANIRQDLAFDPKSVCNGETIEFKVLAEGTIHGYQWQYSKDGSTFADIDPQSNPTAGTQVFVLPNAELNHSGFYRAKVLGSWECNTPFDFSNTIEVSIFPLFEIMEHPQSKVVCQGEEVILNVIPDGIVLDVPDAYRWQKDGVYIDTKENPTANSPILIIPNAHYDQSGSYRCVLHYIDCRGIDYMYSKEAQVYVLRQTWIVQQPESQMADIGETVTFTFDAHVYDYPPDYQPDIYWYRGSQILQETDRITGTKSSYLTFRNVQASDFAQYTVVVDGKCGTAQSNPFALAQRPSIEITQQPAPVTECEGGTAQFQVVINVLGSQATPQYQWFKEGVKVADNGRITGANTETLTINNFTLADHGSYYCVIKVIPGINLEVVAITDPVMLEVELRPVITQPLPPSMIVETGKELKLEVAANSSKPMTYQWMKDGTDIDGETGPVFVVAEAEHTDEGLYTCRVSNDCGSVIPTPCQVTVQLQGTTDVEQPVAGGFGLFANKPNPFASVTVIEFSVPYSANVKLVLTDVYGREVAVLVNGNVPAGLNKAQVNASELNLTSGTYFYTIYADGFTSTKQMVVVK